MTAETAPPPGPPDELPAEKTQASRFGKTRSAQSTALREDYVELIADLIAIDGEARPTDVARRLGVSHATAIKAIARKTLDRGTGARGLRSVIESIMRDVMFDLPSREDVREVVVTAECVAGEIPPLLVLRPDSGERRKEA